MIEAATATVGDQLRSWRQLRRMSQLDLALEAEISARHLSFVETGRSQPSREMILRLAERLVIPLRHRNALLLAAGFAPAYRERAFDDPELQQAHAAVEQILRGHEPFPALAIDRHWTMLAHNAAVAPLIADVSPRLLEPPVNVIRLSLHPEGLAHAIANLGEWKAHLIERLRGQFAASADPVLGELVREVEGYPAPPFRGQTERHAGVFVPMVLDIGGARLSFFSTTTVFGTPIDITLSEIAVEAFFPADPATAAALRSS